MTRRLERQAETRTVKILEVNVAKRFISGVDNYGTNLQMSWTVHDSIIDIPSVGEYWLARREGNSWLMSKRLEYGHKGNLLEGLESGDKKVLAQGTLYLGGEEVRVNGDVTIEGNLHLDGEITGDELTSEISEHNHDDRYYTESETDALLDDIVIGSHNHDDRYYTESESDTLLGAKAPISSPTFTGDPKAPTPSFGDDDTSIATTAFVQDAIDAIPGSGPHAEEHELGGGDEITGDNLRIELTPSEYTPDPAPFPPGDDPEHLTAHLRGIDDELATKANTTSAVMDGDGAGGVLSGTYPNPGFASDMATQAELDTHKSSSDHDGRYYTESEVNTIRTNLEDLISESNRLPTTTSLTLRDDFNRANGGLGANWVTVEGSGPLIDTNQIKTFAASDWSAAVWATALAAPHTVRVDLAVEPTVDNDYHYLLLLDDDTYGATESGYAVEFDNDYWDLWRITAGSWTRLNAWSGTHDTTFFQNGDAIELGLRGNDVVFYRRRGGHWQELGRVKDSTHRPTLMYRGVQFGPGTTVRYDNFRA